MLMVFCILYALLHLIMMVIESIRYRRMYASMSVSDFLRYEITFLSFLLLTLDLSAVCMSCYVGFVCLLTGETAAL